MSAQIDVLFGEGKKEGSRIRLRQEEGKKSSFILDPPTSPSSLSSNNSSYCDFHKIAKPAHAVFRCRYDGDKKNKDLPFLFAGFEIVSNSRNIEVYATKEGEQQEEYIQTCRGTREEETMELYKTVMVQPSGPTSLTCLKLNFLSLRPPGEKTTHAMIQYIKWKGALPQIQTSNAAATEEEATSTSVGVPDLQSQQTQHSMHTQPQPSKMIEPSDIKATLIAMTSMARSTEENIIKRMHWELQKLQRTTDSKLQQHSTIITEHWNKVQEMLINQNAVITQQQKLIEDLMQKQDRLIQSQNVLLEEWKCSHYRCDCHEKCHRRPMDDDGANDDRNTGEDDQPIYPAILRYLMISDE